MTHPDEPLWRELEHVADVIEAYNTEFEQRGESHWIANSLEGAIRREATHALRREAPLPGLGDVPNVPVGVWGAFLDAQWLLRDREQDERQRQREAGR